MLIKWTVWTLVLSLAAMTGCSGYVNIPSEDGSVASENANRTRVQDIQIQAINAVIDRQHLAGPIRVTLVAGSLDEAYDTVLPQIRVDAVGPGDSATTTVAMKVTGVRIRAYEGQVDLAVSGASSVDALVTVSLKTAPFNAWWIERVHPWGPIVDPTPAPTTQPATTVE